MAKYGMNLTAKHTQEQNRFQPYESISDVFHICITVNKKHIWTVTNTCVNMFM